MPLARNQWLRLDGMEPERDVTARVVIDILILCLCKYIISSKFVNSRQTKTCFPDFQNSNSCWWILFCVCVCDCLILLPLACSSTLPQPLNNFISVGIPSLVLDVAVYPQKRGFFCDDKSLKYPIKTDTISSTVVFTVGVAILVSVVSHGFFISDAYFLQYLQIA